MIAPATPPPDAAVIPPAPRAFPGPLITALIVAFLAVHFAWPTRDGKFLDGDDIGLIRDHYLVNHPSWPHAGELLFMVHGDLYQPLPMLTFMANYAVSGTNTLGYHDVNIALHALNAILAAMLLRRLARDPRVGLLAGAMFAIHPMAMEPVAWITGRIILLATTFSLLTLLAFTHRRESPGRAWSIATLAAWLLALASKVLPAVPFAAVWCDLHVHRSRPRRWVATLAGLLLATAGMTTLAWYTTQRLDFFRLMQAETTTSLPARMLIASGYYFRNYLWPTRLSAWSPPPDHVPLLSPLVLAAAAGWLALLFVMAISWRRCRPAAIGLGLFILLIAPFMAAMTARTFLTADRYMYLPILGLHLAVAAWAVRAWDHIRQRMSASLGVAVAAVPVACVGLFWLHEGHGVARVFRDSFTQAERTIALYPDDVRAWVELVRTHVRGNDPKQALDIVAAQRRRWPDNPELAAEAGQALWMLGDFRKADAEFRRALAGRSTNDQARYYWGNCLESLGRRAEARKLWQDVLAHKSHFLPAATALARSFRDGGDLPRAVEWFNKAIELNVHHRDALFELALIHMQRADWPAAIARLRDVLTLDPDDRQAQLNLATCLTRSGDPPAALALYDALRTAEPDNSAVRFNRAELLTSMQRPRDAEAEYRDILQRWPDHRAAAIGLHELLASQGRAAETVAVWDKVLAAPSAPPDAAAWRAFALALAGREVDAQAALAVLKPDAPGALLAAWTRVWLQLDAAPASAPDTDGVLRTAIDAAAAMQPRDAHDREQLRAVILALLERTQANSEDFVSLDSLAHALLAQGDRTLARQCAKRSVQMNSGPRWRQRAESILRNNPDN